MATTFLRKAGIYLEDLDVKPEFHRKGFGRVMLSYLAQLAKERDCGRLEWWGLDWHEAAGQAGLAKYGGPASTRPVYLQRAFFPQED